MDQADSGAIDTDRLIFLVRHGEALKNLQDSHGGPGTQLTPLGRQQIRAAGEFIAAAEQQAPDDALVIYHNVPQVEESADILASIGGWKQQQQKEFRGTDLGILAGLTRKVA